MGHAVLFHHGGNCFAILPSHVARADRFSLELPLQQVIGAGTAFLRDDTTDLALAYVEGAITAYCSDPWTGFARDLGPVLERNARGQMVRLSPEGIQDRTDAQLFEVTPDLVVARTTDALAVGEIYQGSSGSVLEVAGQVAGIAQSAPNTREAVFLRMDEIVRRLGPQLMGGGAAHPGAVPGGGFRVTGWSGTAAPSGATSRLDPGLLAQPFVAALDGGPPQIEITLDNAGPVALQKVEIATDPAAAAGHSLPKTVLFEVDAGAPGAAFWRSAGQRDMPPSGALEFLTGGIYARRVKITVQSVWFPERGPLRIDRIAVE